MKENEFPGWLHPGELKYLNIMATHVPRNGYIVEIGSWKGTSLRALAEYCHPSVSIHCFDDYKQDFGDTKAIDAKRYFINTVRILEYENVILHDIHSPPLYWDYPVDFVFIDAKRALYHNMNFWYNKLTKNGFFTGHDFNKENEDVIKIVSKWAKENHKTIELYGSIWRLV